MSKAALLGSYESEGGPLKPNPDACPNINAENSTTTGNRNWSIPKRTLAIR